jgi:hypothetical protein
MFLSSEETVTVFVAKRPARGLLCGAHLEAEKTSGSRKQTAG